MFLTLVKLHVEKLVRLGPCTECTQKDFSISQAAHIQTAHKMTPTTPQTTHPQVLTTNIVYIRRF
jgi:hypothetical protein